MRHQEVIYAVTGQSFFYDPPEWMRPSGTPTVQVFTAGNDDDGGTAETATTGACSLDATNTTLSSAATAGSATVVLTDGSTVDVGRRYVITATSGLRELVEVTAIVSNTATMRRPLANAFGVGATFQGTRISIAVNTTWSSTSSKLSDVSLGLSDRIRDVGAGDDWPAGAAGYRLRWAYTVDSIATIGVSFADLVRYPTKNLVSPLDVDDRYAGWIDTLPIDHRVDQGARLIVEAFDAVRLDALGDAQVLRRFRDTAVLHGLVVDRTNVVTLELLLARGADVAVALAGARDIYKQRYQQLVREPKIAVDATGGGANASARRAPVWRK